MAGADEHIGHGLGHHPQRALFMRGIGWRPDEGHRHRLHALALEDLDGGAHVVLVQRLAHRAVGQHALAHRQAQPARHQLRRRRVVGVVAVALFLVAQADLDAVLVASGAQETDLDALQLDQRVQRHGGAIDAQIAVAHDVLDRAAQFFGHLRQAGGDGAGAVLRRGCALEQADLAVAARQHEIGEGATGVHAEAILSLHGGLLNGDRGCAGHGWRSGRAGRRRRWRRRTRPARPRARPGRCRRRAPRPAARGYRDRRSRPSRIDVARAFARRHFQDGVLAMRGDLAVGVTVLQPAQLALGQRVVGARRASGGNLPALAESHHGHLVADRLHFHTVPLPPRCCPAPPLSCCRP